MRQSLLTRHHVRSHAFGPSARLLLSSSDVTTPDQLHDENLDNWDFDWQTPTIADSKGTDKVLKVTSQVQLSSPRPQDAYGDAAKERAARQNFFIDVLNVSATRRDTKQFLQRLKPENSTKAAGKATIEAANKHKRDQWRLDQTGVNLGSLYVPARAIARSPVFSRDQLPEEGSFFEEDALTIHMALVQLRAPQGLSDAILDGVALTLTQLVRLDTQVVIVVDVDKPTPKASYQAHRDTAYVEAERLVNAIGKHSSTGARHVQSAFATSSDSDVPTTRVSARGPIRVSIPDGLMLPLQKEQVVVVAPIAFDDTTGRHRFISADEALLALTREFAGLTVSTNGHSNLQYPSIMPARTSVERIVVLDPVGGIPSADRDDQRHVFINLEQEYKDILRDISSRHCELCFACLTTLPARKISWNPPGFLRLQDQGLHGNELYNQVVVICGFSPFQPSDSDELGSP
ncbi:Amino-acid acetyltransferase, mitochondrial [Elasticomyces elasticus]|nr:Amino-acid acetyltransferase, mitochondrial [Elasticomyces elasticus]